MIKKEKAGDAPRDPMGKAGFEAEKQMAFYLRRAFAEDKDIHVFNDVRFERNGEVAQIDHLVLHRFGFVLVESKSVSEKMEVSPQLEFVRVTSRRREGMPSPIQQVKQQAKLLRQLLNDHKEDLRKKAMFGYVQCDFNADRFKCLVAISDNGEIIRIDCNPDELVKADVVTDRIRSYIGNHQSTVGLAGFVRFVQAKGAQAQKLVDDKLNPFSDEEMASISEFLFDHMTNRSTCHSSDISLAGPVQISTAVNLEDGSNSRVCSKCQSSSLRIHHGKYGYYFKCLDCSGNTNIKVKCGQCGEAAKIRKKGLEFYRVCDACSHEDLYFTNSPESVT